MAEVKIKTADKSFLQNVADAAAAIREKAYDLFELRGRTPGYDIEDWLRAEMALFFVPDGELSETETGFSATLNVGGFQADEIMITAAPHEIVIMAASSSENESRSLHRRFQVSSAIDPASVKAGMRGDSLVVEANKANPSHAAVESTAA